jgi:hypothetical protein
MGTEIEPGCAGERLESDEHALATITIANKDSLRMLHLFRRIHLRVVNALTKDVTTAASNRGVALSDDAGGRQVRTPCRGA